MEADRAAIYRPRKPRASPLWQCVSRHLAELRASGRVRRAVERNVLERFLECGDPHHGFARIRCGGCGHDLSRKAQIDAVLLKFPGVSTRKINGLDAYFVNDRMFACISGKSVGLRLPVAKATELQFSRNDVMPFQPGVAGTTEWIQIDRAEAAEYEQDLQLFQESLEFVRTARTR